jgi:CRP/FNR family transcriptional regulator
MITQDQLAHIAGAFPLLRRAEPALVRDFQDHAFCARFPAGKDIFVEGDRAEALALVLSGVVRVYKIGKVGREITLYRFGSGESCILTANAILSQRPFPALATVEQAGSAVMIPAPAFQTWVGQYDLWREFFFDLLSLRLMSVLTLVDDVVFRRMDARVAALLDARCRQQNPIRVTHQEIAAELGSSREVISRVLEGFGQAGVIRSGRGLVEIVDFAALETLCAG